MKRSKSAFCVLLVLAMLLCIFSLGVVSAGAASGETHTITYDVQGIGTAPESVTVADGESFDPVRLPDTNGYRFFCWVKSLDFEEPDYLAVDRVAYLGEPVTGDMTLYAFWLKPVNDVELTVNAPRAGEEVGENVFENEDYTWRVQTNRPAVSLSAEGYYVTKNSVDNLDNAYWLKNADDIDSVFKGKFENGKSYGALIDIEPDFGYYFTDSAKVTVNGKTPYKLMSLTHDNASFIVKLTATDGSQPATDATSATAATNDSANKNNANGSIATNESKATVWIFVVVIGIVVAAGVVYFIIQNKNNKK